MKKIVFFLILCLNFSCNNLEKKQSKVEIPTGMIFIQGGEFLMGADNKQAMRDEYPQHKVLINSFLMDATEVTNADFKKFIESISGWEIIGTHMGPGYPEQKIHNTL